MTYEEAQRIASAVNSMNPKAQATESSFANVQNFKDPTELNSFADALFNTRAKNSKEWIKGIPSWATLGGMLPIKSIAAMLDVAYTGGIKPLLGDSNGDGKPDWDFKAVGINALYNLMETMDVVANPIKGAIIEGFDMKGSTEGLSAVQGFSRGLGMGAEGRAQYDYNVDTGAGGVTDFIANFALELISDPLNWLDFGAGAVVKSAGKKLGSEILTESAERASRNFVEKVLAESIDDGARALQNTLGEAVANSFKAAAAQGPEAAKAYMETIQKGIVDTFTNSKQFAHITKQAARDSAEKGTDILVEIQNATKKMAFTKFDEGTFMSAGKEGAEKLALQKQIYEAVSKAGTESAVSQSNQIVDAMGKLYRLTDKSQQILAKSVIMSSPVGLGLVGAAAAGKKLWSKFGSTAAIKRAQALKYIDTAHIDMVTVGKNLDVLDELQAKGLLAPISEELPGIRAEMAEITAGAEMDNILGILAKHKDPVDAQNAIGAYIKQATGKTVQEYLDYLSSEAVNMTRPEEVRALYGFHRLRLEGHFSDLEARAIHERVALDKKFFAEKLEEVRNPLDKLALRYEKVINKNLALKKIPLRAGSPASNFKAMAQASMNEIVQHPKFAEYTALSPTLLKLATQNLDELTIRELDTFLRRFINVSNDLDRELAPMLKQVDTLKPNVFAYINAAPLERMRKMLEKITEVDFMRTALDNKWIYDLKQGATYTLRIPKAEMMHDIQAALKGADFPNDVTEILERFEKDMDTLTDTQLRDRLEVLNTELQDEIAYYQDEYHRLLGAVDKRREKVFQKAKVVQELNDAFKDLSVKAFEMDNTQQIDAMQNIVGYIIKSSQINARLQLMQTEGFQELIQTLNSPEGIKELDYATLLANKAAGRELTEMDFQVLQLRMFAKSVATELEFYNRIVRSVNISAKTVEVSHDELVTAFLDTVQSYSKVPLEQLRDSFDAKAEKICESIMNNINGNRKLNRRSNKLQDVLSRAYELDDPDKAAAFSEMLWERFKKTELTFHDAEDDVIAAQLLAEYKLPPEEAKHIFSYDIEHTPQKHIIQIAWRYGDQSGNYLVRTPKEMLQDDPATVRKLSGLGEGYEDAAHYAAFQEKYANVPEEQTEQWALDQFFTMLNKFAEKDKDLRLVGHNVKASDEVILLKRASEEIVAPGKFKIDAFRNQQRYDTYLEEVKQYGYLDFEDEPELKQRILDELDILIRTRLMQLDAAEETGRPLFEQLDAFTAFNMRAVADILDPPEFGLLRGEGPMRLRFVATQLLEELRTVRWTNRAAENILIDKNFIPNMATYGGDDALNIMQYLADPAGYFGGLSAKILVDTSLARTLFDTKFVSDNVLRASEYARRIQRTYNKLGDVETLLDGQTQVMRDLFKHLKAMLPKTEAQQIVETVVRKDTGAVATNVINTVSEGHRNVTTEVLKHLQFPEGITRQAAVLLWLTREVKKNLKVSGGADVSQTLLANIRNAIGAETFDEKYAKVFREFNFPSRIYGKKTKEVVNKVVEAAEKMARDSAMTSARLMVDECKTLLEFSNQQYDFIRQSYRFDTKYELAFASELLDIMDNTLKVVSDLAAVDKEVGTHLYRFNDAVFKNAARYVLGLRGDALRSHVYFNAYGIVRIDLTDWMNDKEMMGLVEKFIAENKDSGLGIATHNRKLWITTQKKTGGMHKTKALVPDVEDIRFEHPMPREITENLLQVRQKIHTLEDGLRKLNKEGDLTLFSVNSTGTLISSEAIEALKADMPKSLQTHLKAPEIPRDVFKFDYSNIGSPAMRNMAYQYAATNPVRGYYSVLQTFLARADAALKMRLLLTSDSSFVRFSNLFDGVEAEDILKTLKRDRVYRVLMAVKSDAPFGYSVKELKPNNLEDIELLRKSEAIVVDHNTHRMLRNVLNRAELTNGFAKFFNNVIVSPTKAGMLTSPGVLVRNLIDSTIKNYMGLDSPTEVAEFTTHMVESSRWLRIYKDDMKQILSLTLDHHSALMRMKDIDIKTMGPNKASIDAYFAGHDLLADFLHMNRGDIIANTSAFNLAKWKAELTPDQLKTLEKAAFERNKRRDIFDLTHTFIAQGPSAGYVSEQQALIDAVLASAKDADVPLQERIKRFAWSNPLTANVMSLQSEIEQLARYSKFTWEIRKDASVAEAMHRVIDTHFDYSTKSLGVLRTELIVPFFTFALANAEYWTKLMSRNGWAFGMLRDMYSTSMQLSEYDQYELQNNRAIQYAVLNGTMPLFDSGFSIKLSPSYMDTFNMLMAPIESGQQRISKAVAFPLELFARAVEGTFSFDEQFVKDVITTLPFAGVAAQRFWHSDEWALKGSAVRSTLVLDDPLEKVAVASLNSIFSAVGRSYFFAYPSANEVWSTYDEETYFQQLAKGAVPIITTKQAREVEARMKKYFYYGEKEYSTYNPAVYERNIQKGATVKPVQRKRKTFVSFRTTTGYTRRSSEKYSGGVVYHNKGYSARPFGRTLNLSHIAPAVWRRVYTAGGNNRFKARLTKPSAKNLQYRIRMGWRYWR